MSDFITTVGVFIFSVAMLGVTFAMLTGDAEQIVVAAKSTKVQPGHAGKPLDVGQRSRAPWRTAEAAKDC